MSNKIKSLKKKVLTFTIAGAIAFTPLMVNAELGDQTLVLGMKNPDVQTLKTHLIDLNYLDKNNNDKYFDNMTREAVQKLQQDSKIQADGMFGPKAFKALQEAIKSNLGNKILDSYNRVLKLGSKGEDVKLLQEGLKELGFLDIEATNPNYTPSIEEAVRDFQYTYNLDVDGLAGKQVFNTLGKVINGEIKRLEAKVEEKENDLAKKIISSANSHKGKRYVFGASGPNTFDCSGFTQYVYRQNGINIPRTTKTQANAGKKVTKSQLKPGDLIIFSNTYQAGPSHAGIYMGNNNFIHASSGGKRVMVSSLSQGYYKNKFSYGRRVF